LKLTEEHQNCECHDMLNKTDVCMPEKCHIIHEDTLDLYDMYQEKAEKWDKYSQQFETALRVYTDCKTMEEFFIKNQLPKFLVTITEDGKTKMEKIDSVKKLEQENKQLKELLDAKHSMENVK